jgi:hypothetical protein
MVFKVLAVLQRVGFVRIYIHIRRRIPGRWKKVNYFKKSFGIVTAHTYFQGNLNGLMNNNAGAQAIIMHTLSLCILN